MDFKIKKHGQDISVITPMTCNTSHFQSHQTILTKKEWVNGSGAKTKMETIDSNVDYWAGGSDGSDGYEGLFKATVTTYKISIEFFIGLDIAFTYDSVSEWEYVERFHAQKVFDEDVKSYSRITDEIRKWDFGKHLENIGYQTNKVLFKTRTQNLPKARMKSYHEWYISWVKFAVLEFNGQEVTDEHIQYLFDTHLIAYMDKDGKGSEIVRYHPLLDMATKKELEEKEALENALKFNNTNIRYGEDFELTKDYKEGYISLFYKPKNGDWLHFSGVNTDESKDFIYLIDNIVFIAHDVEIRIKPETEEW